MSFSNTIKLGFRQGNLRTSTSSKVTPIRLCRSDARLFSSLLAARSCTGLQSFQKPASLRHFSLWGSSSKPAPVPEPTSGPSNLDEATLAMTTPGPSESTLPSVDATSAIEPTSIDLSSVDASAAESIASQITDVVVNNVPAALQYGDLTALGLAGWSPAGIIRWSMELINVTTGMPWFWTIIAGSAFWRIVCVPLAVKGLQASSRLQPHQTELVAMQENIKRATATKDPVQMQKASLLMKDFYKKHDINPLGGLVSLIQLPITLGLFFAVQKLCTLPVEQLKFSGVSFLPDLTAADPTYFMPLALCALINLQISVGAKDVNTIERPDMGHFMNVFRILTIPGIWFMSAFPSGLILSLMTTAILTTTQSMFLRLPAVRHRLGMPITPPNAVGKLPSLMSTFRRAKSWMSDDINSRVEKARREALARQRATKGPGRRLNH